MVRVQPLQLLSLMQNVNDRVRSRFVVLEFSHANRNRVPRGLVSRSSPFTYRYAGMGLASYPDSNNAGASPALIEPGYGARKGSETDYT